MDTEVTDDQRALLEVSTRFMEDACPLRAVRDGAWKDDGFAATYRRQAAELGWFSMLVPESLGGGSVSGNGVARRRADRLRAGRPPAAGLVRRHQRRRLRPGRRRQRRAARTRSCRRCCPARPRRRGPAAERPRRRPARRRRGRPADRRRRPRAVRRQGRRAGRRRRRRGCSSRARRPTGRPRCSWPPTRRASTVTELDSLDITRRFAEVRFDATPGRRRGGRRRARAPTAGCWHRAAGHRRARCIAAESVGAMDHDFEMTVQYAKDRIAFGRPIGSFQG